jgi:hypothetical protein
MGLIYFVNGSISTYSRNGQHIRVISYYIKLHKKLINVARPQSAPQTAFHGSPYPILLQSWLLQYLLDFGMG